MQLSIIIINYNTLKLTLDCIASIHKHTKGIEYEILVIDNNSQGESLQKLETLEKTKKIVLIKNKTNEGFIANNYGMKIAKGKYILLLNSDTLLIEDSLSKMYTYMESNPLIGIASCCLLNRDKTIQGTGGYFPTLPRVFNWMFFIEDIPFLDRVLKPFHPVHVNSPFYMGTKRYEKSFELDWVTGAFFLMRKELIKKVGYLDPEYFMYTEEVDYCYRAKQKGYIVYYTNITSLIHLGGASSTKEFPILSEYKNIQLFYRKHMPKWHMPLLRLFLRGGALIRSAIYWLKGQKTEAAIHEKAYKFYY